MVTSANVACGFHAGDPSTLRAHLRGGGRARRRGRRAGRLPRPGRLRPALHRRRPGELADDVLYQLGALDGAGPGRPAPGSRYVKPHGALYNTAVHHERAGAGRGRRGPRLRRDAAAARACPGSALLAAAEAAGLRTVPRGLRRPRLHPARARWCRAASRARCCHDPDEVAARVVRLVTEGAVAAVDGTDGRGRGRVGLRARRLPGRGRDGAGRARPRSTGAGVDGAGLRMSDADDPLPYGDRGAAAWRSADTRRASSPGAAALRRDRPRRRRRRGPGRPTVLVVADDGRRPRPRLRERAAGGSTADAGGPAAHDRRHRRDPGALRRRGPRRRRRG